MAIKTGLERVAQALRWLSWGWLGIAAIILAVSTIVQERITDEWFFGALLLLVAGVLPAALGHLVAWIIDGFARKDG